MPLGIAFGAAASSVGGEPPPVPSIFIEKIRHIEVSVGPGESEADFTLDEAMDVSRTIIWTNGFRYENPSPNDGVDSSAAYGSLRCYFVSPTTIRAQRTSGGAGPQTAYITLLEAKPEFVDSVQHVSMSIASMQPTGDVTISPVDLTRSAAFFAGNSMGGTLYGSVIGARTCIELINANTVRGTRIASATNQFDVAQACVVQFNAGAIKSIQRNSGVVAANTNTETTFTIDAVDPDNTIIALGGFVNTQAWSDRMSPIITLDSPTSVVARRANGSNHDRRHPFTVIEFEEGVLARPVEVSSLSIANAADGDAEASLAGNSVILFGGLNISAQTEDNRIQMGGLRKLSDSSIGITRGVSDPSTLKIGVQVVEFN